MNAKGPKYVKERAIANTDPAVLAECGHGEWPLKWAWEKGELADDGNYLENDDNRDGTEFVDVCMVL